MKTKLTLILLSCLLATKIFAGNNNDSILKQKQVYYNAKTEIENMLKGKTQLSYEKAVFIMENAYLNNEIDYDLFKNTIDFYTNNIITLAEANRDEKAQDFKQKFLEVTSEEEKRDRYNKLLYNWAIYKFMTDTTFIVDSSFIYYHIPYEYSYNDPMASIKWENSQVLNLFYKRKANCFALASLYKIFAERLNTDANLGLAPGHIYITHNDVKGINYNVELASRAFPGVGSIMTLTYSTIDAVQSGIAMRTLDLKQSVALCLVYLAKGYEHRFNTKTDNFLYQCAETTLQYDSLNLNAILLKAEVLEEGILNKKKTITQLQSNKQFKEYEKLIAKLYVQGYREMPLDMKNLIVNKLQKDSTALVLTDHTAKGFKTINPKDDRHASLSWGMFDEEQLPKEIEQYSKAIFNTRTKKITKFVSEDILYNKYNFDPVVAAWQIDPLAAKYPNMSPYSAFENNPIYFKDKDGKDAVVTISGNNITVSATIQVWGSAATQANASKIQSDIMKVWGKGGTYTDAATGKTYNVKFQVDVKLYNGKEKENPFVIPGSWNPKNTDNYLEICSKPDELNTYNKKTKSSQSHVDGGDEGQWRGYGSSAYAHEFGHLLGLDDLYNTNKKSKDYGAPIKPEYINNIMNDIDGKLEQKNINDVVSPLMGKYNNYMKDRQEKIDANKDFNNYGVPYKNDVPSATYKTKIDP